jgi:hypothetical protein
MASLYDLLAKGYLPAELPPSFSTESLANCLTKSAQPPSFEPGYCPSKVTRHSLSRPGALRRHLGIPNPVHQFALCTEVSLNWTDLTNACSKSAWTCSTPLVASAGPRALTPKMTQHDLLDIKAARRANSTQVVRTDISEFYHSIYTHSLPWALHSKAVSKLSEGT